MEANQTSIDDFMATAKIALAIPVYQRNYDWTEIQCEQLLNDILEAGKSPTLNAHFIGSIVYVHNDIYTTSGKLKELTIIDGQQRLTTITLIYAAIYQLAVQNNHEDLKNEIYETYLINKFAKEEKVKLKLKPTENNIAALQYILGVNPSYEVEQYSRVVINFNYFRSKINMNNLEIIRKGLYKLIFVEISLDRNKDNPQRIFESMNSTGLDLSQADLIRNYILMSLEPSQQATIYNTYWLLIEKKAKDEERQQNKISDFIRDYLTAKNNKIPNKEKVYVAFKEKYPTDTFIELEKVLKDIKPMVEVYHKLLNPKYEQDKDIQIQLNYLKLLDVSVTFPFLMQVYKDYIDTLIDKSSFIAVLETVQSYIWRRFILGYQTTGLNKVFMNLHEKVDKNNYLYSVQKALVEKPAAYRFPENGETESFFKQKDVYNINSSNRMYLFERIENHLNREKVTINGNEDLTIEHIFPQNPDIWWQINLGEQECAAIKEKYLHTIGNLTISGNNGALGNKPFLVKKEMNKDGKEQGYKFSRLWLNRDLKEKTIWNVESIKQRTETIAKRFLEIWQFPNIPVVEEQNNEMNIFEADEPKGKKLQYVVFFDQKYDINNITKLYVFVFSQLFELKATTFFTTELSQKAWISTNKSKLRKPTPLHLNSNYFIDTHSASIEKFDRIKKALEIFGYEDKLIIKYAEEEDNDEMGGLFS